MKLLDDALVRLPTVAQKALAHTGSLVVGIVLAVLLHYVLYRIGLPSKPLSTWHSRLAGALPLLFLRAAPE